MTGEQAAAKLADILTERAAPPKVEKPAPVRVDQPGIYPELTPAQYHEDPAPEPSLSASIAICLITKTPFHAFVKHKRLAAQLRAQIGDPEDELEDETSGPSRFGTVAHELLLGRGQGIHVITETKDANGKVIAAPKSYSHKETQRIRDEVLAQGATPCLVHELDRAEGLVDSLLNNIRKIRGCESAFVDPLGSEVPVLWREDAHDGVWGRILIDSWGPRRTDVWDLKTTRDLSDDALRRKIANEHIDARCAFYERGLVRADPSLAGRVNINLVFAEAKPPFEARVVRLPAGVMAMGHKKVSFAFGLWAMCLRRNRWPGYPERILRLDYPSYAERLWTDREESESAIRAAISRDPFLTAMPVADYDDAALEYVP